jgi:dolichol-phosphate mannosyltransferase
MSKIDHLTTFEPNASNFFPEVQRPLVILPTYNEAKNIIKILDSIEAVVLNISILVVDDSSPDGTSTKVTNHPSFNKSIFLLKRPQKNGLGSAYRDGFQWGIDKDHDVFLQMDSDFSHNPNDIPRFLKTISEGIDIVVGSRYLNGVSVINWPLYRLLLSIWAGMYTRFFTGMPLSDPTTGFVAIRRNLLERIVTFKTRSFGYAFLIEMKYFAWVNGFAIKEIPIVCTERQHGQSKLTLSIQFQSAIRVILLGLKRIFEAISLEVCLPKNFFFRLKKLLNEKKV